MAEIPSWAWLLVGIFVVAVSTYVGKLQFFVIVGALMIAWGVFRIAVNYMVGTPKQRKRPWEKNLGETSNKQPAHGVLSPVGDEYLGPGPGNESVHRVRAVACPECKTQVWNTAHFCHFCGARLRSPR